MLCVLLVHRQPADGSSYCIQSCLVFSRAQSHHHAPAVSAVWSRTSTTSASDCSELRYSTLHVVHTDCEDAVKLLLSWYLSCSDKSSRLMQVMTWTCTVLRLTDWARLNVPPNTLWIISGTIFTRYITKPTVSKHWRKPFGLADKAWIAPGPHHHVTIIQL